MTKLQFKNRYTETRRKEEFDIEPDKTQMTDQSQLASASIVEMAKKYGIEAIIAKANQTYIDETLQNKLYGHDYTKMFTSAEERLNVKNKLTNLFENIPAKIRKEQFQDSIANFIDAYVTNDEEKLTKLNTFGIVSDSQLNSVKEFNRNREQQKIEEQTKNQFIQKLNEMKEGLYENYKTTGSINLNDNNINTENNNNI